MWTYRICSLLFCSLPLHRIYINTRVVKKSGKMMWKKCCHIYNFIMAFHSGFCSWINIQLHSLGLKQIDRICQKISKPLVYSSTLRVCDTLHLTACRMHTILLQFHSIYLPRFDHRHDTLFTACVHRI